MSSAGKGCLGKLRELFSFSFVRALYDWTLSWADSKYGAVALFVLAFAESSFFPIPPDILLIALCVSANTKSFRFAVICTVGSVLGGVFGYFLGFFLYETIGVLIISALNYQEYFDLVGKMYSSNAFVAVLAAALTPIPYKVFTIAAGVWRIDLVTLIIASIIGRGARFFLVAGLIFVFGKKIKAFIDKYFNLLVIAVFLLIVIGFFALKYFF
jgi:membrane protein YqaA with SNARE-associated domain